ncbi:DUF6482 family protein [Biformimicrobium ophioploci]|uniref:NADH-quinone reductase n=1 Tax=Biformimicrobium ophioploci TaxID=3036711 RepID=A0ABQ6LW96_9GAMM|nr:DUF6482 family protein [Microbulbifer sp. NKW57]GMG86357.1 hypothetical protein MNKW57_06780 [Microbulbifer sp. NKW57]
MNLQIRSLEGNIYLVETVDDTGTRLLTDRQHRPVKFHCLDEIRQHFHSAQIDEVWLEQQTPYEEMCGLGEDKSLLRMKLKW